MVSSPQLSALVELRNHPLLLRILCPRSSVCCGFPTAPWKRSGSLAASVTCLERRTTTTEVSED